MKNEKEPQLTQREIDKQTDLKLYEALKLLEQNNLLYFRFLKRLNFMIEPKFKAIGGVGYHDKKKKIFLILQEKAMMKNTTLHYEDPRYIEAVKDVAGLLEHECGHVMYDHIFHKDVKINAKLKNVAEDFIINEGCNYITSRLRSIEAEKSESILKGGCFFANIKDKIPALKGVDIQDITSIELYRILQDFANGQKKQKPQDKKEDELKKAVNNILTQIDQKVKEQNATLDEQSLDSQNKIVEKQKELTARLKKLKMKEEVKLCAETSKEQESVAKTLDKGE